MGVDVEPSRRWRAGVRILNPQRVVSTHLKPNVCIHTISAVPPASVFLSGFKTCVISREYDAKKVNLRENS